MKTFSSRLAICLRKGQMAQGDLRWWFGRSYSTTASWLRDNREPRGPAGEEARRRLALLEKGIALKKGFPVPVNLSSLERPAYIENLYHAHSAGVSRKNTAGRRLQMRDGVS
jgi:hypothetical protein